MTPRTLRLRGSQALTAALALTDQELSSANIWVELQALGLATVEGISEGESSNCDI